MRRGEIGIMKTETISLDEFFNKYDGLIYKIEYYTTNNTADVRCRFSEEVVLSKDNVKKHDNLFFRPDIRSFVSGVVIDDKVFCIIGDTSEEEKLDDSIIKNLMADPDKNMYDIHVEFAL